MAEVSLGNVAPIDHLTDQVTGLKTKHRWSGIVQSTTQMHLAPESTFERLRDAINIWHQVSDEAPAWTECPEDPEFARMLHKELGGEGGGARPAGWEHVSDGPHMLVPVADKLVVPGDATNTTGQIITPDDAKSLSSEIGGVTK